MTSSAFSRDAQLKSMELTISNAEKHMGQFCTLLASYTRKTAKLRDKADALVQQLQEYANTEGPELRICLKNFSEDLAMVQDYRQAEVERLETRVVSPLKAYGAVVKSKRADLKRFSADRTREMKELQRLEKIRLRNPADRQSIAETNVQKASSNANRSSRQMEETIDDFQRQKLTDVKRVFTEFIRVEMLFHAKALEVYTHTFNNLETMDIDKELEFFRSQIQISAPFLDNVAPISGVPRYPSRSPSPLYTLTQQPSLSNPLRAADGPKQALTRTWRRQQEMEEEEEDEEEDDEEEEEGSDSEEDLREPRIFRQSYAAQYTTSLGRK